MRQLQNSTRDRAKKTHNSGPKRLFVQAVIAAGVALAGLERVDFFAGMGPFVLTPYLLISPLILITFLFIRTQTRARTFSARTRAFLMLLYGLCIVAFASLLVTESPSSWNRFLLLVVLATSGLCIILLVQMTGTYKGLRAGAVAGLAIFVVLNAIQWSNFQISGHEGPDASGILNLSVVPYGENVIRLSGASLDPNRAAVTIATYVYILIGDPAVRKLRGAIRPIGLLLLGIVLVSLTISRSGLVVFLFVMVGGIGAIWRSLSVTHRLLAMSLSGIAVLWTFSSAIIESLNVRGIASSRFDLSNDGSANSHFGLLERGLGLVSDEPGTIFTGLGYGSSYLYLQDFFPGNDYGNFHSTYITMLVECGILALIIMCLLMIIPMFGTRRWLAIGVAFFGVFYQGLSDPIFWIQISLLWVLPPTIKPYEKTAGHSTYRIRAANEPFSSLAPDTRKRPTH